jgi:hypothetical protein
MDNIPKGKSYRIPFDDPPEMEHDSLTRVTFGLLFFDRSSGSADTRATRRTRTRTTRRSSCSPLLGPERLVLELGCCSLETTIATRAEITRGGERKRKGRGRVGVGVGAVVVRTRTMVGMTSETRWGRLSIASSGFVTPPVIWRVVVTGRTSCTSPGWFLVWSCRHLRPCSLTIRE